MGFPTRPPECRIRRQKQERSARQIGHSRSVRKGLTRPEKGRIFGDRVPPELTEWTEERPSAPRIDPPCPCMEPPCMEPPCMDPPCTDPPCREPEYAEPCCEPVPPPECHEPSSSEPSHCRHPPRGAACNLLTPPSVRNTRLI